MACALPVRSRHPIFIFSETVDATDAISFWRYRGQGCLFAEARADAACSNVIGR